MENKFSTEDRILMLEDKEERLSRQISEHEGFIWRAKESRLQQSVSLVIVILQIAILMLMLLKL